MPKPSRVDLLFGRMAGYDPETGAECLHSGLCRVCLAEGDRRAA